MATTRKPAAPRAKAVAVAIAIAIAMCTQALGAHLIQHQKLDGAGLNGGQRMLHF